MVVRLWRCECRWWRSGPRRSPTRQRNGSPRLNRARQRNGSPRLNRARQRNGSPRLNRARQRNGSPRRLHSRGPAAVLGLRPAVLAGSVRRADASPFQSARAATATATNLPSRLPRSVRSLRSLTSLARPSHGAVRPRAGSQRAPTAPRSALGGVSETPLPGRDPKHPRFRSNGSIEVEENRA
jgi:hypothetical protein